MSSFTLDMGLAKCYDTACGVGIHGRAGADTNARKRGIHWGLVRGWLSPMLCYLAFHFHPKSGRALRCAFTRAGPGPFPCSKMRSNLLRPQRLSRTNEKQILSEQPAASHPDPIQATNLAAKLFLVGLRTDGAIFWSSTSDGETYSTEFSEVDRIHRRKFPALVKFYLPKPRPAATEYQPDPPAPYEVPLVSSLPINQVDVTVIGRPRNSPHSASGFKSIICSVTNSPLPQGKLSADGQNQPGRVE